MAPPDEPGTQGTDLDAQDLRTLADLHPEGTLVLDTDGVILYANHAAEAQIGTGEPGSLLGVPFGLPVTGSSASAEVEVPTPSGSYRVLDVWSTAIEWQGSAAYLCTTRDVTSSARQLRTLRQDVERLALAIDGSNDGLWDWAIDEGTLFVSQRWRELLGLEDLTADDNDPALWLERTHPEDKAKLLDEIDQHLRGQTDLLSIEHRLRHDDGDDRWMLARGRAVFDDDGEPLRLAGSLTDISQRKALESQLLHDARHDPLTGLGNRRMLVERAGHITARAERTGVPYAIALLDLDGFKQVNDRFGHDAGDQVLIVVADRLRAGLRPSDVAARLGGDEFAIVLEALGPADAAEMVTRIALRLQEDLKRPHQLDGMSVSVPASIGVAVAAERADISLLLRMADQAMYRAKSEGVPVILTH